ncbi:MAG: UDP-N-acetylglucosamine 2-epimerase (non-hydrolyzing) [Candidatus Omnitrophica bacterium]|nr:UDP-N-acetylglucosamine 2-epimerase (non-hydrolyzing) [Candidatus Omnitrophota bacterium]
MLRLLSIVGARPNFVKLAALQTAFEGKGGFEHRIVHAGQHYDYQMSQVFFRELGLSEPNYHLDLQQTPDSERMGRMVALIEPILHKEMPDWVIVVGDVDATMAAAIAAKRIGLRLAHVEAGLRSFDWSMPEEINRIITDRLSDLLFVSEAAGVVNLLREGVEAKRICFVGNVMIDTLFRFLPLTDKADVLNRLRLSAGDYGVVTLHRPSNTDTPERLCEWMRAFETIAEKMPLIFPAHPRTIKRLQECGYKVNHPALRLIEPMGYLDMIALLRNARVVFTDSGGIQEETTALGVRCFTLRDTTERPSTVEKGTNRLIGNVPQKLLEVIVGADWSTEQRQLPEMWDGRSAQRIAECFLMNHSLAPRQR